MVNANGLYLAIFWLVLADDEFTLFAISDGY